MLPKLQEDELRQQLKMRVDRLAGLAQHAVQHHCPPDIITREIGLVVVSARSLFGRELVDRQIDSSQRTEDARNTGICVGCLNTPALPETAICGKCLLEAEKYEQDMILETLPDDQTPN